MAALPDAHEADKPDKGPHADRSGSGSELGADPAKGWMARARCRGIDPEVFFPHNGAGVEVAARICGDCGVRQPCLDYALANHIEEGVWGGLSERARRRLGAGRSVVAGATSAVAGARRAPRRRAG